MLHCFGVDGLWLLSMVFVLTVYTVRVPVHIPVPGTVELVLSIYNLSSRNELKLLIVFLKFSFFIKSIIIYLYILIFSLQVVLHKHKLLNLSVHIDLISKKLKKMIYRKRDKN